VERYGPAICLNKDFFTFTPMYYTREYSNEKKLLTRPQNWVFSANSLQRSVNDGDDDNNNNNNNNNKTC
jgi:hypothetical protein